MNVIVRISRNFKKEVKPLLKRYPSLAEDLILLEKELLEEPRLGTALGYNTYKIRLRIKSKGKGKSGGARVISLVESIFIEKIVEKAQTEVTLLSIYDKADADTISDTELKKLIKNFMQNE